MAERARKPRDRCQASAVEGRQAAERPCGKAMISRSLRRLDNLSGAAIRLGSGTDERNLIVSTLLKILDECSDADYDVACRDPLRAKLVTAGVVFDAD